MSVTGSCHLVTTDRCANFMDCGLFCRSSEALEELNYQAFDFDPVEIDFILLSHAHVDHCAWIPLLVKQWIYRENLLYRGNRRNSRYHASG